MRQLKLTREEQAIEDVLLRGEYRDVDKREFEEMAHAVAHRRRDALLSIRVNSED